MLFLDTKKVWPRETRQQLPDVGKGDPGQARPTQVE